MNQPKWTGMFDDVPREHGFEALEIEGTLPDGLAGTLWLNGAGRFSWPGHRGRFWLDADGAVTAMRLGGGRAEGACRLVRTRSIEREREAGRMLYGRYDRRSPRLIREMWMGDQRNSGNTSVWAVGEKVFALCPQGVPIELDPASLEARGEEDFDGLLRPGFSAHASHGWRRGTDYNFGMRNGLRTSIDLFAFPQDGAPHRVTSFEIDRACFLHDFALTDRWAVFFVHPFHIRPLPLLFGLKPLQGCFEWKPEEGTEIVLVDLDAPDDPIRFRVPPHVILHWANAWDDERGRIIGHAPVIEDMPRTWRWLEGLATYDTTPPPDARMSRLEIDPTARTLHVEPLTDELGENPRMNPFREQRPSRFTFHSAFSTDHGFPDRIVKLDAETGRSEDVCFGDGMCPSEAVLIPRSDVEDDGWLVSLVYDPRARRSGLAIADALRPGDAPVATAWMDHHVPPPFHGTWVGVGDRLSAT